MPTDLAFGMSDFGFVYCFIVALKTKMFLSEVLEKENNQ